MADYGSIADEEEVHVNLHRPLGAVVQVRFTEEEVRAIASVARADGLNVPESLLPDLYEVMVWEHWGFSE